MTEPTDSILIHHLTPRNFLSFGSENNGIDLVALNVFIGPNGSGKSNLIEAISLLRAAPKEFADVTRKGGGVTEWIWKGDPKGVASVDVVIEHPHSEIPLRHVIEFRAEAQRFKLVDERVTESIEPPWGGDAISYYHGLKDGKPMVLTTTGAERSVSDALVRPDCSIVGQLFDPSSFAELASLSQNYEKVRIYREWAFGRSAVFREPQQADMRNNFLEDDFSNLGLFLSKLRKTPKAKKAIIENLRKLYDGLTDFEVVAEGGSVQVFFTEGDFVIPAARLSDGTLRFLCLLAILCDPEPPPLICIEEPELGLHPDILPTVADLLKSASERTQIIVTTHSDILVDAMTDCPESVVVCEKHKGQTEMTRLSASELAVWLEKYRLGQLWIQGQLGGTRW
ncbi:MAG: AAA family ATPase [Verrucomicrobia bacterium]|nr:AAA family ATPase [Verrucomicrobiota bacterium]